MRLVFHGQLKELYGAETSMAADTVAEAIEGFSRQANNWPKDMRIAVVADSTALDTMEKLKTHYDVVHLMPTLAGGSGKFTNIILGAAVIAGAFIPGLNTAIGVSLLISGSLMVAQGVIGLFLKSPKITSVNDPEASKYLAVNKNTTDVGTPIVMAWGLIDLAGQWVSLQSDSNNLAYGVYPATPS